MAYLQLNRLIILKGGNAVYDEVFHSGINIIRGENGVGKSTIANAIYYVLGGDFSKWLPEIEKCDYVIGEVDLNGKVLTLRREITRVAMQPMSIFYGTYEAGKTNVNGWVSHNYRRSSKGLSYSQVLFKALDYPEIETAEAEYITFNQALRLMYIDQTSPLDELMKDIEFDSPLIRKTTADLLLGVYDNSLFNLQLLLKDLRKSEMELQSELKLLKRVYASIQVDTIERSIKDAEDQIEKINNTLMNREKIVVKKNDSKTEQIVSLQKQVTQISELLQSLVSEESTLRYDIVDSQEFIDELSNQTTALIESEGIRSMLGDLKISYCPSCLQPTKERISLSHCELCKESLDNTGSQAQLFRIRQQLEAQIKESRYLLQLNETKLEDIGNKIVATRSDLKIKQRELNLLVSDSDSDKNQVIENMLVLKGKLIQQIQGWQTDLTTARKYWSIYAAHQRVTQEIENASQKIDDKKTKQRFNYQLALEQINKYSKELLKKDGVYEAAFINAEQVSLDFARNTYALDDRNHFSASSQVILKNSVRFGIFFASLILDFIRYPRFILCDNVEDKGMSEIRSRNFQKNLVELASRSEFQNKRFQIIFTTSMVEQTLDKPAFTIGSYYTSMSKTLKQ